MPLYIAGQTCSSFSHLHDYEPAKWNHYIPHHGIVSQFYKRYCMLKSMERESKSYASYKKN